MRESNSYIVTDRVNDRVPFINSYHNNLLIGKIGGIVSAYTQNNVFRLYEKETVSL